MGPLFTQVKRCYRFHVAVFAEMARLRVRGYLVSEAVSPDYEIDAQDLIDKFIGDDTGAPLASAVFTLETDDGYEVTISVDAGSQRRGRERPASFQATVDRKERTSTE